MSTCPFQLGHLPEPTAFLSEGITKVVGGSGDSILQTKRNWSLAFCLLQIKISCYLTLFSHCCLKVFMLLKTETVLININTLRTVFYVYLPCPYRAAGGIPHPLSSGPTLSWVSHSSTLWVKPKTCFIWETQHVFLC